MESDKIANKPTLSQVSDYLPLIKKDTSIFANYFQVKIIQRQGQGLHKYGVTITPDIGSQDKLLVQIMEKCKKALHKIFSYYVHYQWILFSRALITDKLDFKVEFDGQPYTIIIDWQYEVQKNSSEFFSYVKHGYLQMMRNLKFEQIGRNCFEPAKAIEFPQYKIEMWPGYDVRLNIKEAGVFLNIEPCHKIVRFETGLEVMKKIIDNCDSRGQDFRTAVASEFSRTTVVTLYNKKSYQISDVAFDMSPNSSFQD